MRSKFETLIAVDAYYSNTAVLEAVLEGDRRLRSCVAMMVEAVTQPPGWGCFVCGRLHPMDHEGIFCGGCFGMACCGCEIEARGHRCPGVRVDPPVDISTWPRSFDLARKP